MRELPGAVACHRSMRQTRCDGDGDGDGVGEDADVRAPSRTGARAGTMSPSRAAVTSTEASAGGGLPAPVVADVADVADVGEVDDMAAPAVGGKRHRTVPACGVPRTEV
ncbi:hypothetical protein [Streptomyces sp. NPDC012510]|uniref:hypothetical protein n=1 Tax=Streptomyces sp. NPDC012510 TaxID=3364838 RepID=UPI0036F12A98